MKTDQLMSVSFVNGTIDIFHKSQMGNLKQVFILGNKYRLDHGDELMRLDNFLKRPNTKKYIKDMMLKYDYEKSQIIKVVGRGRGTKTYANLQFIIYCATELNNFFRMDVIDTFINERILIKRDDGGNDFKELNNYLDKLPDRKDKNNQGIFIQVAIKLREKIFTGQQIAECKDKKINIWNSSYANTRTLEKRDDFEKKLIFSIQMDFIDSYEKIKEVIDKIQVARL
jgi:hypothetical protein